MPEPILRYYCPWGQQNGYSRASADYIRALHAAKVPVEIVPLFSYSPQNVEEGYGYLNDLVGENHGDPTHLIIHAMPCEAARQARNLREAWSDDAASPKVVILTTWENDSVTTALANDIAEVADLVIVPSTHCKRALRSLGMLGGPEVVVVPHCFDSIFWSPSAYDEVEDGDCGEPFVFYTIGQKSPRKNLDGLLEVYLSSFVGDDVILRIICPQFDEINQRVEEIEAACNYPKDHEFARVEIISQRVTMEDLRHIHCCCDCYISLSRGEGWGLGAFEAALMGNPVIVSRFGGWSDYLSKMLTEGSPSPGGFKAVRGRLSPVLVYPEVIQRTVGIGGMVVPIPGQRIVAAEGVNARQNWFDPDPIDAARCMFDAISTRWWRNGARAYEFEPTPIEAKRQAARVTHGRAVPLYGYSAIASRFIETLKECR